MEVLLRWIGYLAVSAWKKRKGRLYEMPNQGPKSEPKMPPINNNTGTPSRPRPKTIHVDAGSNDAYNSRTLSSSKGKRGSGTNLAGSFCVQPKLKIF